MFIKVIKMLGPRRDSKIILKQTHREFDRLVTALLLKEYSVNSGEKEKNFLTFTIVKELQKKNFLLIYLPASVKEAVRTFWGYFLTGLLTTLNMVVASQTH